MRWSTQNSGDFKAKYKQYGHLYLETMDTSGKHNHERGLSIFDPRDINTKTAS